MSRARVASSVATASATARTDVRRRDARSRAMRSEETRNTERVRIMTFNVLCPAYKRSGDDGRESDDGTRAMTRTMRAIELVTSTSSDVMCAQEFWHADEATAAAWMTALERDGYWTRATKRTSGRCDGLLTAVKKEKLEVLDARDVLFNDCGDRVACVVRARRKSDGTELIVVNTHLLFPHNENSSLIRLRECFKILEYLRGMMREPELRGRKVPIVVTGDFNGSNKGRVYQFFKSQGFVSALDSCQARDGCVTPWISHLNHHGECVGVDHMFLLNPSRQVIELGASWKEAVFAMMRAKIVEKGLVDDVAAFAAVDENDDGLLSKDEFFEFANRIGLCGEKSPGLLPAELEALYDACDKDGNGMLDFQEFVETMDIEGMAQASSMTSLDVGDFMASSAAGVVVFPMDSWDQDVWEIGDLAIKNALLPDAMIEGQWPSPDDFDVSDHGPLVVDFALQ